jgi:hypothetical protein
MAGKNFKTDKPTNHNQKRPFDPTRYGKLWANINFELRDEPAYVETGKQPIIGSLMIAGRSIDVTWSETNRIIEQLYDGQHRFNVAKRLGMLNKGSGTPRDIKYTHYDSNGKTTATNIKE